MITFVRLKMIPYIEVISEMGNAKTALLFSSGAVDFLKPN